MVYNTLSNNWNSLITSDMRDYITNVVDKNSKTKFPCYDTMKGNSEKLQYISLSSDQVRLLGYHSAYLTEKYALKFIDGVNNDDLFTINT